MESPNRAASCTSERLPSANTREGTAPDLVTVAVGAGTVGSGRGRGLRGRGRWLAGDDDGVEEDFLEDEGNEEGECEGDDVDEGGGGGGRRDDDDFTVVGVDGEALGVGVVVTATGADGVDSGGGPPAWADKQSEAMLRMVKTSESVSGRSAPPMSGQEILDAAVPDLAGGIGDTAGRFISITYPYSSSMTSHSQMIWLAVWG